MKKKTTDIEKVKLYLSKMFMNKSMAFGNNEKVNGTSQLQSILIGEMMCISELKRFIEYVESENK